MTKTFYIIDGNSLFYRSYYAIPHLSNAHGEPTNAVYGFANTLFRLFEKREIDYIACAFDSPGPTKRHERYTSYKSHRKGMPEDLLRQFPPLKEVLRAMKVPVFEKEGYEADDILATLVEHGRTEGYILFVISGDKDLMQIVREGVFILQPGKDEKEISAKEVKNILGVKPPHVPDLISLMGDSSDDLPGVSGIGPKTAIKLINEYGKLEDIYENLSSINGTLRERLKKQRYSCFEIRDLAILDKNVPLDIDWNELKNTGSDRAQLIKIFRSLNFNRLIQRLLKAERDEPEPLQEVLKGKKDLNELIEGSRKKKEVLFYLDKKKGVFILAVDKDNIFCLPEPLPSKLKEIISDSKIKKIGHGFKEILKSLWIKGIYLEGLYFDTEIASYLINPERPSHDLNGLSLDYFSKLLTERYRTIIEDIFSLKEKMSSEITYAGQDELFYKIEMPMVSVLAQMEKEGIQVNKNKLVHLSKKVAQEISIKEERIFSLAGERFNLNSSQQVGRILFHKMGLPPQKRIKTGLSTDSGVLETLGPLYPIAYEILNWRELYKIKSTYVDGLIEFINPQTGRLHTTFNQVITATGRLSSSKPNLQNIPIRGRFSKDMREVFEAGRGKLLISADYSQIELRILAHLSGDSTMTEIFKGDGDIHTATACQVFKIKEEEVTADMRRRAKTINFGIIYGISGYGLGRQLGVPQDEAQNYITNYMERFPTVKAYLESLVEQGKKNGFARTFLGRRRPLSGPNIERLAINTPIQGGAADIIKLAMVRIDQEFRRQKLKAIMILQVHDELLFEVPEKELNETKEIVKSLMENAYQLSIPLKVNIYSGKNWGEATHVIASEAK